MIRRLLLASFWFLASAGSALAQANSTTGGIAVPEPSDITLFAIGLAGLIIGRRVARRRD